MPSASLSPTTAAAAALNDDERRRCVATAPAVVTQDDVDIFSVIGSGAFSSVYKVQLLLQEETIPSAAAVVAGQRRRAAALTKASLSSIASSTNNTDDLSSSDEDNYYLAMKRLRHVHVTSASSLKRQTAAAHDIRMEASILSTLFARGAHENIVTLHAVSDNFWSNPAKGFLLLDYLPETLQDRLDDACWRSSNKRSGSAKRRWRQVGLPVARALAFLHQQHICHRDMKPENIGFDLQGNVRLYDFAFARQLDPQSPFLSETAGTPRYMAPEMLLAGGKGKRYHAKATDVYSFGILLWQLVTLQLPFEKAVDLRHLTQQVAFDGVRPPTWNILCSKDIKKLLSAAWHQESIRRPTAQECADALLRICCGHHPKHPSSKSHLPKSRSSSNRATTSLVLARGGGMASFEST